jgi:hypothetical protein
MTVVPETGETFPELLYRVAEKTGVALDFERLHPTLIDVKAPEILPKAIHAITLELRVNVSTRERLRSAAAQVREIADLIEAAADKPRGGGGSEASDDH